MKTISRLFAATAIVFLAACATTPSNPFVGAWAVNLDTPIGAMPGTIEFAENGSGSMMIEAPGAEGQPPATFQNATFEGNTVAFTTTLDAQGQQITLTFNGTVEGDNLTGQFDTDFGALDVSGTRKQQ